MLYHIFVYLIFFLFNILDVEVGDKIIEGKTKIVYSIVNNSHQVVLKSKDCITAGDGSRADSLSGKAAISTSTTVAIFKLLNDAGKVYHTFLTQLFQVLEFQNSQYCLNFCEEFWHISFRYIFYINPYNGCWNQVLNQG